MALLPLKDDNPVVYIRYQYVTLILVAACLLVFVLQLGMDVARLEAIYNQFGVTPLSLRQSLQSGAPGLAELLTLISYQFLHGDWLHLLSNLLFMWVFADNIEDELGHGRFLLFYLACGMAAALTHVVLDPSSPLPMIGASGAVSGVLGAYLLLHPRARVLVIAYFPIPLRMPTYVVLGMWIVVNLVEALLGGDAGVAWWAHVGGFAAGMLLVGPMSPRRR